MATTNEKTLGTRISNAEKLLLHLKSFNDYVALHKQDEVSSLEHLIIRFKDTVSTEAGKAQIYTIAVDTRQKLVRSNNDSLQKITTPIISYIRAAYGKDSRESNSIKEKVGKIRGSKATKPKIEEGEENKSISTSQTSYASLTLSLSDLISSLTNLSPAYNPTNADIKLPKLQEKLAAVEHANNQVASSEAELSRLRSERIALYATLKESCLRIKDTVKSQYGSNSFEYGLIKGLKF